jgi:hypothetical protein
LVINIGFAQNTKRKKEQIYQISEYFLFYRLRIRVHSRNRGQLVSAPESKPAPPAASAAAAAAAAETASVLAVALVTAAAVTAAASPERPSITVLAAVRAAFL